VKVKLSILILFSLRTRLLISYDHTNNEVKYCYKVLFFNLYFSLFISIISQFRILKSYSNYMYNNLIKWNFN